MPKTAVLYARYSSDKQREASIDDQLRVCREFCESEKLEVVGIYTDYALSGKTDKRPQFQSMISAAPESDYVVVYSFDRFSRSRYDSTFYKKALHDVGVKVLSANEHVDDSPEGDLHEGILEVLSEYYVADLKRKVRRGMDGNALKAKDNGYKIFGYDTDPVTRCYVVNEAEAAVVREIYDRYLSGDSMLDIAKSLAARGWVTTQGNAVNYNWVHRILNREAYTGLYSWGGIEVEGGMPVVIDKEMFQKIKDRPRRRKKPNAKFPLTGKLYCGECGLPMHGSGGTGKSGKRYFYYMCLEKGTCRQRVRKELVEGVLVDASLRISSDEAAMRRIAKRIVEAYDEGSDVNAELDSCEARMDALEEEQHRISQAVFKGLLTDEIVERNKEIESELKKLHNRRGVLMSQMIELTEDDIVEFLMHGMQRDDEEYIFGSFIQRAYLYPDCVVAVFNFRDELGDLYEERIALDSYMKQENTEVFSCCVSGVGGGT